MEIGRTDSDVTVTVENDVKQREENPTPDVALCKAICAAMHRFLSQSCSEL